MPFIANRNDIVVPSLTALPLILDFPLILFQEIFPRTLAIEPLKETGHILNEMKPGWFVTIMQKFNAVHVPSYGSIVKFLGSLHCTHCIFKICQFFLSGIARI